MCIYKDRKLEPYKTIGHAKSRELKEGGRILNGSLKDNGERGTGFLLDLSLYVEKSKSS